MRTSAPFSFLQSRTVIVGVILVAMVFAVPWSRNLIWTAVTAVFSATQSAISGLSGQWLPVAANPNLRQERDTLRQQVAHLTQKLSQAQQTLETVKNIQNIESYLAAKKFTAVTAPVIAFSPDPGIQSIVIGKGSTDGLKSGMAVVATDGILIGTIQRVHERNATVLLLVDSQAAVSARIQNTTQSIGLVRGERGLSLRMDYIPKNDAVSSGQTVVTSGSDAFIPPDIVIGPIQSVTSRTGDLFQQAIITVTIPYTRVSYVSVIIH